MHPLYETFRPVRWDAVYPRCVEDRRRWLMLGLGMGAQASSCIFLYGLPYLLPRFQSELDLSLAQASTLIVFPTIGLLLSLVAWGALADRYGERIVMATGLLLATTFLAGAAQEVNRSVPGLAATLLLAGAGGASVNAASGRLVLGWFSPRDRGLAMGPGRPHNLSAQRSRRQRSPRWRW